MSFWDGSFTPAKKEWRWEERRVYDPFVRCSKTNKKLFLKKAYYGRFFVDWTYKCDKWLSKNAYTIAVLKGEFDD